VKTNLKVGKLAVNHNEVLVRETARAKGVKVKTNVKAGGITTSNHNKTLVRETAKAKGVRVRSNLKAGGLSTLNHNQTLIRETAKTKGVKVRTNVKAGGTQYQHNETLLRDTAEAEGVKVSQNNPAELSDKDLEQAAGGIIVIGGKQATPVRDEAPEESVTFIYNKIA
jgi:hypothetical protein